MVKQRDPGEELNWRLRKGTLPQMVDWFDPLVLGAVAVRTLISRTIEDLDPDRQLRCSNCPDTAS